jgi:hypothetical protein
MASVVASRYVVIYTVYGDKPVLLEIVVEAKEKSKAGKAMRFVVIVGEDLNFLLKLLGLPAPNYLMSKPALRG